MLKHINAKKMHAFGELIPLIYFLLLKRYWNKKKKTS